MISAVWESREAFDQFRVQRLIPTLAGLTGGFTTTAQERVSELMFFQTAT